MNPVPPRKNLKIISVVEISQIVKERYAKRTVPKTTRVHHFPTGTSSGTIQVYNLSSGQLNREFSVHSCSVRYSMRKPIVIERKILFCQQVWPSAYRFVVFFRGIEWVSLHSFLSYACHNPGASGLVKNEVILTDILTGC